MRGPTGAAEPCNALAKQDKRDPSPNLHHPAACGVTLPCRGGHLWPWCHLVPCVARCWGRAEHHAAPCPGSLGAWGQSCAQRGWPWGHRGVPTLSRAGFGQRSPGAAGVGAAGGGHPGWVCTRGGGVCAGGVPGHFSPCFGGARLLPSFVIPRLPPPLCVCVCARVLSPIVRDFFSTVWAGDRF